jgi:hypothetical protein
MGIVEIPAMVMIETVPKKLHLPWPKYKTGVAAQAKLVPPSCTTH